MYYVYIIRCMDNSLYTGITNNVERRMFEHFNKTDKCAKYTYTHTAKELVALWETSNRVLASKLEYHIKKLSKSKKEFIINNNIDEYLSEILDTNNYKKCKLTSKNTFNLQKQKEIC